MLTLWCGFLLFTHFFCHVLPLECDSNTQYGYSNYMKCCKKCAPGEHMVKRCTKDSDTKCKDCSPDFYMDEYSNEMECKRCAQCTKEHMVYKKRCTKEADAQCGCESGYQCNTQACTSCEKIPTLPPTTIKTTTTTTTTAPTTITPTTTTKSAVTQDTVWITLSLCCVCILLTCFILISRITPAYGWIMLATAGCFWRSKKTYDGEFRVDEEVPMPVQEVCEHKEWKEAV